MDIPSAGNSTAKGALSLVHDPDMCSVDKTPMLAHLATPGLFHEDIWAAAQADS